ncbi:MAG: hypothetical protein ACOYJA_00430 [Christensenellales bacterium]|jgi:hypothetical protein
MHRHRIWFVLALACALALSACAAPESSGTPRVVTAPPVSPAASTLPSDDPKPSADAASQTPAQSDAASQAPAQSDAASQAPAQSDAASQTPAPTDRSDAPANSDADELPVLVIGQSPRGAKLVLSQEDPQAGTYRQTLEFDEVVTLTTERLVGVDHTETAVKQALSDLSGGAQIRLSYSASLSERLGRPVYRATYATEQGGATLDNTDVYIQTDGYDYRLHISVPSDVAQSYNVDGWVDSVDLFSAG